MNRKIPSDAFSFYVSLGTGRSYEQVAQKYGVTKRAIVDVAAREDWQERMAVIEKDARDKADVRAAETLDQVNERHLTTMKLVQRKALEALRVMSIGSAMDAVRALRVGVEQERIIRGESAEGDTRSIEAIIRLEYERFMLPVSEAMDERAGPDNTPARNRRRSPAAFEVPQDADDPRET